MWLVFYSNTVLETFQRQNMKFEKFLYWYRKRQIVKFVRGTYLLLPKNPLYMTIRKRLLRPFLSRRTNGWVWIIQLHRWMQLWSQQMHFCQLHQFTTYSQCLHIPTRCHRTCKRYQEKRCAIIRSGTYERKNALWQHGSISLKIQKIFYRSRSLIQRIILKKAELSFKHGWIGPETRSPKMH